MYKGYIKTTVGNEIVAIKTGKCMNNNGQPTYGVCIDGEMLLLIMPFMSNGSVLENVRKHKDRLFITGELLRVEVRRINHVDKHVTFVYIAVTTSICCTS